MVSAHLQVANAFFCAFIHFDLSREFVGTIESLSVAPCDALSPATGSARITRPSFVWRSMQGETLTRIYAGQVLLIAFPYGYLPGARKIVGLDIQEADLLPSRPEFPNAFDCLFARRPVHLVVDNPRHS